jgi:hypothetical protein
LRGVGFYHIDFLEGSVLMVRAAEFSGALGTRNRATGGRSNAASSDGRGRHGMSASIVECLS